MTEQSKASGYIDFKQVKADADVPTVLSHLGLLDGLAERGDELVGWCPLGSKRHGKKASFAVNPTSKVFQCFACNGKGSIIDLVANVKGAHIRDAAAFIDLVNRDEIEIGETDEEPPEELSEPLEHPDSDDIQIAILAALQEIKTELVKANVKLGSIQKKQR